MRGRKLYDKNRPRRHVIFEPSKKGIEKIAVFGSSLTNEFKETVTISCPGYTMATDFCETDFKQFFDLVIKKIDAIAWQHIL